MKRRIILIGLIISSFCLATIVAQPKPRTGSRPIMKSTAKPATELPPQPKCNTLALPDITIEEFKFAGPGGPWKPGQKYSIGAVVKNIGQCETGVFFVKLDVRVQVPSMRKDETLAVGTKKLYSIQPRKTGVSNGTYEVWFDYTTGNYQWAQYTFTAVADSTNHIEEFNEANNEKTSIDQVVDTLRQ